MNVLVTLILSGVLPVAGQIEAGDGWTRHAIDAASRGADGVRLADFDGDGDDDIVTGWEEGGQVRVCLQPEAGEVDRPWPSVAVGQVRSPEDAVIADLDGDGVPEVISCCEGRTRSVFVHKNKNPSDRGQRKNPDAWTTEALPATVDRMMWMWCVPMQVDGRHGIDLVLGGKGEGAEIGWLEAPGDPKDLDAWTWHTIRPVGWIMSIRPIDLDGDGDLDLLCSDRKGPRRGVFWLDRVEATPGESGPSWVERPIGGRDSEVMFLDVADLDGDGTAEVLAASRDRGVWIFRRQADRPDAWDASAIALGPEVGSGKAVAAGDLDGDGRVELVVSTEGARGKHGIIWLTRTSGEPDAPWEPRPLSGTRHGTKYDLVRLLDLDNDGDLDVLTCEERDNLGVIWYENPTR